MKLQLNKRYSQNTELKFMIKQLSFLKELSLNLHFSL